LRKRATECRKGFENDEDAEDRVRDIGERDRGEPENESQVHDGHPTQTALGTQLDLPERPAAQRRQFHQEVDRQQCRDGQAADSHVAPIDLGDVRMPAAGQHQ
jgi:hypothetical protein